MANPAGHHQDASSSAAAVASTSSPSLNANGVGSASASDGPRLKHNPGISLDWTPEEQAILEDGLSKYVSLNSVVKYAKIAVQLNNKTVRDVAMRCRWMTKKESSKRRKEEHNSSKKSKDKKEKVADASAKSSQISAHPNVPPYAPAPLPVDNDDGIPCKAIGGPTGELLEQNAQAFNQISANLSAFKIQDNVTLFCQTRDNILKIMNDITDYPEIMKQMPPLPVKAGNLGKTFGRVRRNLQNPRPFCIGCDSLSPPAAG
ncbi:hypothetical protein MLD38_017692 [Melastoma candidum]|uniref:Uncharacterized protein n=1 Tax=Melastoma candidum TaxID=119954 RepID=A0ACB9QQW7_9MYRT|nr:hypothetical protein MLD38_017692 [Melastoma candidum]